MDFRNGKLRVIGTDRSGSGQAEVAGSIERGNKLFVSIKRYEVFE